MTCWDTTHTSATDALLAPTHTQVSSAKELRISYWPSSYSYYLNMSLDIDIQVLHSSLSPGRSRLCRFFSGLTHTQQLLFRVKTYREEKNKSVPSYNTDLFMKWSFNVTCLNTSWRLVSQTYLGAQPGWWWGGGSSDK